MIGSSARKRWESSSSVSSVVSSSSGSWESSGPTRAAPASSTEWVPNQTWQTVSIETKIFVCLKSFVDPLYRRYSLGSYNENHPKREMCQFQIMQAAIEENCIRKHLLKNTQMPPVCFLSKVLLTYLKIVFIIVLIHPLPCS